jgi:hypothetical protein
MRVYGRLLAFIGMNLPPCADRVCAAFALPWANRVGRLGSKLNQGIEWIIGL